MFAVCAPSSRPTSSVTRPNTSRRVALGRDRRGDAPQRGLLVGQPAQRLLGRAALGDVAHVAAEQRRAGQVGARDRQLDRELGAVLAHPGQLDRVVDQLRAARSRCSGAAPLRCGVAQCRRDDQRRQLAADHLRGRVAERPLGRLVDLDDVAAVIHRHDAVEGGVEDRASCARRSRGTACCARQRSTNWPIWEPRLLIVSSRSSSASRRSAAKNSITPSRPVVPRTGNANAERSPARGGRRGAREARSRTATSANHAGACRRPHAAREPFARPQRTARLSAANASALAADVVHASRQLSAAPTGSQTAPTVPRQRLAHRRQQLRVRLLPRRARDASTRATACSVRSRTVTSESTRASLPHAPCVLGRARG